MSYDYDYYILSCVDIKYFYLYYGYLIFNGISNKIYILFFSTRIIWLITILTHDIVHYIHCQVCKKYNFNTSFTFSNDSICMEKSSWKVLLDKYTINEYTIIQCCWTCTK